MPRNILSEETVGFAITRRETESLNSNPLLQFSNKVTILSIDTNELLVTLAESGSLPIKIRFSSQTQMVEAYAE